MNTFFYRYLTICFFSALMISCAEQPPKLPKLDLKMIGKISYKKKEKCTVKYDNGIDSSIHKGKIKLRGGFSRKYPKHSFSLELKNKISIAGLPADDDWILNGTYIDKTLMRHKLNYDLFRQMHLNNVAAKSAYVDFSIDGEPRGIYVLMQEINGNNVGLNKTDSMAMLFKDPPLFYGRKLDYVQDSLNYYQQKYPKKKKKDHTVYIEAFIDFMFNSSNEQFTNEISDWVDLDNIMDWNLLLMLSNNGDGVMKNFYLYKVNSNTPFRVAVWDYDHSFGREGDNEPNMMVRAVDCQRAILMDRLMTISETNYAINLKKRWKELRENGVFTTENIFAMIDSNHNIIKHNLSRNFEIWPNDSKWYFDDNTYEQEITLMKDFIKMRLTQLDTEFKND